MTKATPFEMVCAFHRKFGVPNRDTPQALSADESQFRLGFMHEELDEYERAVERGDLVKQLDALVDLLYVVYGTMALQGFPADLAFELVHEANMQKRRASSVEESATATGRGHALDVVKPEGWKSPEPKLALLLALHQTFEHTHDRHRLEATLLGASLPNRYATDAGEAR
jgi:predicted HAD superfamily Cof-like phosphohydrolase